MSVRLSAVLRHRSARRLSECRTRRRPASRSYVMSIIDVYTRPDSGRRVIIEKTLALAHGTRWRPPPRRSQARLRSSHVTGLVRSHVRPRGAQPDPSRAARARPRLNAILRSPGLSFSLSLPLTLSLSLSDSLSLSLSPSLSLSLSLALALALSRWLCRRSLCGCASAHRLLIDVSSSHSACEQSSRAGIRGVLHPWRCSRCRTHTHDTSYSMTQRPRTTVWRS